MIEEYSINYENYFLIKEGGVMRLYRYRDAEKMLKFKEIENKNMFFAPSSIQNDPMEGISDIVWNGDYIAWKNLFKNYCMNLTNAIIIHKCAVVLEQSKLYNDMQIIKPGFCEENIKLYQAASQFVDNEYVELFLNYILNRDVRQYELITILKCVHPLALQVALDNIYSDKEQYPIIIDKLLEIYNYKDVEKYLIDDNKDSIQSETLFQNMSSIFEGLRIGKICRSNDSNKTSEDIEARLFIIRSYSNYYVKEISKWCIPNYFMTCFSKSYENSSMWGYYANAHKGVCLIYDLPDDKGELEVKTPPAFGVPYGEKKKLKFYDIDYQKGLIKIDFFSNCLKIMQLKDKLKDKWIFDGYGNKSKSFAKMIDDKNEWLEDYKRLTISIAIRKDEDWKHEKEVRLILQDYWKDEICKDGAAIEYDFSKLVGIIFGINTPEKIKVEIINKLDSLEEFDNNFKFYQAYYDHTNGKISKIEIPINNNLKKINE
ncbi:DUF2971 domain-containing protein [Clostridium perfringens]|uniref:DUF2971 domain-containing protein n=1 Tax=Clostridium perfringens TaxID=1502 RepID=UPI000F530E6D|nr:DUF2971 domain-containing protein [Clostridium perfringens]